MAFCNETLWGSLNATLIVQPSSLDAEARQAFDRAVAGPPLRHGVDQPLGGDRLRPRGHPLGGVPGHTRRDIQSGVGVVHNTLMFSRVQKTVVQVAFRVWPKPVWFPTHRTAHQLTPKLVRFEAAPSLAKLPGLLRLAVRG